MGWLLMALLPLAALFSALSLACATMARSSKEGQYYLMPLLLVTMPLAMIPVLPGTEISLGASLVPVTGVMFLLRALMEGDYLVAPQVCRARDRRNKCLLPAGDSLGCSSIQLTSPFCSARARSGSIWAFGSATSGARSR